MKNLVTLFVLTLATSTSLAAQAPYPKDITCTVKVVDSIDTKAEEVISEKTIKPEFPEANRSGSDSVVLVANKKFKASVVLSFLRYTPLLSVNVEAGGVVIDSGLKAVIDHNEDTNDSVLSTVVECTYVPGDSN